MRFEDIVPAIGCHIQVYYDNTAEDSKYYCSIHGAQRFKESLETHDARDYWYCKCASQELGDDLYDLKYRTVVPNPDGPDSTCSPCKIGIHEYCHEGRPSGEDQ